MSKLMKKLKFLKEKIRIWIKDYRNRAKNHRQGLKDELAILDVLLDRGEEVVLYFFQHGKFPKGSNSFFIALILKNQKAKMVKDFCPITLIGSLYKIIAKILANRITIIMGDIVSDVQSAFVANRQILDGPFMLNELIQWCKKKKKQTMLFKVDFEKAYDSIRWDYLDDILRKFGFGDKWRGWIRNCLLSSKGSVIVNGSPTNEFRFYRGLKQGDPLSPFLFILVIESLHISVQRVVNAGMFKGIQLGSSFQVSHLFYADDTIFIARLSTWKMKTLSIGGMLTLLKSVLGSLPVYHMSLFKVPQKVLHVMEAIRRNFFNGIDHKGKKQAWISWNKVLASKDNDGLGVYSFFALNRALLFKWVWRFRSHPKLLWAKVIKEIHGDDGKLDMLVKNHSPSLWLDIVSEVQLLKTKVSVASKMSLDFLSASFRRAPRSGVEEDQYIQLVKDMEGVFLVDRKDRWSWSLAGNGDFLIASIRKELDDRLLPLVSTKTRWIRAVPIKINIHAWKVKLDSLPTRPNISKRESCSAKELFQLCKQYDHVVDTFIPNLRSKTGRRFGFVRFINVFNEEILVNNLCTVWIDSFKLHANIAMFHRTPLNEKKSMPKKAGGVKKDTGVNEVGNSYVHVVKGQTQPENKESEATHALVLSDECLLSKDLSKSLFGRVKQFASLANIRKAVSNEGFADIKIQYMGELWVMMEFVSTDSMKLFQDNVSIGSWFSQLKQAFMEFNTEGRIAWVEVEGIPFKLWSDNTFKRIATNIYKLLKKKKDNVEKENNSEHSMKYPPGFTPKEGTDVVGMHAEESRSDSSVNLSDHNAKEVNNTFSGNCPKKNSKEDVSNSTCSGHFKTSMVPRTGGSILSLMDELVKVGQVMGYKMDGCLAQKAKKDWVKELCVKNKVSFLALQETKMENMELFSVKMCWGNFVFDYVHSDSVDFFTIGLRWKVLVKSWKTRGGKARRPILLRESHFDYGRTPFRFFHHWIEMEGFSKVVADAWREGPSKYKDELEALEVIIDKGDGNSGGILCVWDPNSFHKSNATVSDYFIMIRCVWWQTGNDLLIIVVYVPRDLKDKQMLWDYLTYEIGK
nr:RNA-directed DNA polymerase, eukaryota, reverse transcriptase zinc-binding domain protein [Tanacetum cinerariifolium]